MTAQLIRSEVRLPALQDDLKAAVAYATAEKSQATRRAYAADWHVLQRQQHYTQS